MFIISSILTLILVGRWRKRFDVNLVLIFFTVDIANLGFLLYYMSTDLEEALIANKLIYIGGCFLPVFVFFLVIRLCRFNFPRWGKVVMTAIAMIMFMGVLTTGIYPVFYRTVKYRVVDGIVYLDKEYTVFHTIFTVALVTYFAAGIAILAYTYIIEKRDVSQKMLLLLVLPFLLCITGFWYSKYQLTLEVMPILYNLSLVFYLLIMRKLSMYDIIDTGIKALSEEGDTGFLSLDSKLNFMGCDETVRNILPHLANVRIDTCIRDYPQVYFRDNLMKWLDEFTTAERRGEKKDQFTFDIDDRYYSVNLSYLMDGRRRIGYQFFFIDDTRNQIYMTLVKNYNRDLEKEVAEKTEHIVEMHDRLITSMATVVESRDNSTGGHVRRTSDLVRMLVTAIRRDNRLEVDDEFCRDIIKAAPMHDLGKIAVDDRILRKPGRFEPEEFEQMKKHAPEGARIVHEILKGTDDEVFHYIAENVAHYHHERWDGSGYPDKLAGEDIPLEARIMAIADVYDALVSKRVYKDKMSFEKADQIITEGMGSQFDPQLEPYYVAARPEFEKYYTELEKEEEKDAHPDAPELCDHHSHRE